MKSVIQRVRRAEVSVNGDAVGAIEQGLMVLVGVEKGDSNDNADKLLKKLLKMRVFADENGKMNLNMQDITGGLLLVSQFTLAADLSKGNRPGFSEAAPPELAKSLYDYLTTQAKEQHAPVATGIFAADMQISLINDGPVTFILNT